MYANCPFIFWSPELACLFTWEFILVSRVLHKSMQYPLVHPNVTSPMGPIYKKNGCWRIVLALGLGSRCVLCHIR